MRLGVWNRLAIVATGLGLLIAPVAFQIKIAGEIEEARSIWYNSCLDIARERPLEEMAAAIRDCDEERSRAQKAHSAWRWALWLEFAIATLITCAIFYTLIWGSVSVVRWVWRGKDQENTDTA
jgi:hypothetical protein